MSLYIFPDTTLLTTVNTWTNLQTFLDVNFELTDNVDLTKIAKFELSGISTATTRTYTLPNITATLAHLGNAAQTFSGSTTFSNPTVTVGNSAATATYGLGVGATSAANTKTINIGTSGVSTSTTNINIGSATSNTTIDVYGILEVNAAETAGVASNGLIKIHGKDFGTVPATITQGAFSLAPWLLINSGSDANSFVSIQSANSGYTWTFNNAGVLTVPGQIQSSVATGTAPFTVASTTVVTNLNADTVDSYHVGTSGSTIPLFNGTNSWSGTQSFLTGLRLNTTTTVAGAYNGTGISLQSHAISAAGAGYTIGMWALSAAAGGALEFIKSRAAGGVIGVAGVVADGDTLGRIVGSGYNSTPSIVRSAEIAFVVSGTPTASSVPSKIEFLTSGTTGTATSRVEIGPTGLLSALNGLTVTGTATLGTSVISLGGNFTTSGAFATTLTATAATSVTLPTSGTLVTTAATAQTLQGNITFSGNNTFSSSNTFSKGATLGASAGPTFKFNLDFASDVANTWRRFIVASLANIQYSTIGFKIRVTDPNANHATQASVTADFETYMVACVRTEATTLDTPDLCVVRGPSNRIRAVKTSTGNYEIQIQNEAQFREYFVEVDCYAINGSHTITYENGSTVGSTGTAQYDASVGASIFFTEKLTAKGSITADAGATFTAGQTVAFNNTTGTAPFTVASTTQVTNLNASQLAGSSIGTSGATIPLLNGTNTFSGTTTFSNPIKLNSTTAVAGTYNLSTISLQSHAATPTVAGYTLGSWNTGASSPAIEFLKSRSTTVGGLTAVISGDNIGQIIASGVNSTPALVESSAIRMTAAAAPTASFVPGKIAFWTSSGTAASTTKVDINENGLLRVYGTDWPNNPMWINQQTFSLIPQGIINSGTNASSFISIQTANSAYTWSFTNVGVFSLASHVGFPTITSPGAAPAGRGYLYAKDIAGRVVPEWVGPSGVDYPLQPSLAFNNVRAWRGGATTAATTFASTLGSMPYTGASPTAPTIPALASTNLLTQTTRSTISTGATAGGIAYIRGNQQNHWRGNAAGLGGFMIIHRFAISGTLQAGMRAYIGIVDVAANPTNVDPLTTTAPGGVGLAVNTNTGNWSIVHNITGTARTATGLGASFPLNNTSLMELVLWCVPNGASIGYHVTNLSTGAATSGTLSTNIPASTTFLAPSVWVTNNATAAAQTLDFISTYVETDY